MLLVLVAVEPEVAPLPLVAPEDDVPVPVVPAEVPVPVVPADVPVPVVPERGDPLPVVDPVVPAVVPPVVLPVVPLVPEPLPVVDPVVPAVVPPVVLPVVPVVPEPLVLPVVPAVVPVPRELPGVVMVPPLAPRVPPVVAPPPVTEFCELTLPRLPADAPASLLRVEPLEAVCAIAPPVTREATRRLRSLLINKSPSSAASTQGLRCGVQPAWVPDALAAVGRGKASQSASS
jgi:signal-induced proliferation-associated 1 like protein 3